MRPFINISSPHGNVVFNFTQNPIRDLTAFALGYREAAHVLATRFIQARGYADYEGYPILYLYRHSLELYLKAVVYRGAMLMGLINEKRLDTQRLFHSHKLGLLLPAVSAIFKTMKWDFNFEGSPFASFEEFEELVKTIDKIDENSYSFRYPIKRDGTAPLPHHFVINVIAFAEIMDTLLGDLEGAADLLEEDWQTVAEAEYEVRQYLDE